MKAKLIIKGQEFDIEVPDNLQELISSKRTGYERVETGDKFWCADIGNDIHSATDNKMFIENKAYKTANYYSSCKIAENNVRADNLMRKLRRFAVEHRENEFDWTYQVQRKYYIYYGNRTNELLIGESGTARDFGVIYFDSEKTAKLAIETFKDELIWYFTEYKDSL